MRGCGESEEWEECVLACCVPEPKDAAARRGARGGGENERWGRVSDGSCVQEPKDILLNVELEQNAENVDVDVGGRESERWGRVMHACWLRVLAVCKGDGERGIDR